MVVSAAETAPYDAVRGDGSEAGSVRVAYVAAAAVTDETVTSSGAAADAASVAGGVIDPVNGHTCDDKDAVTVVIAVAHLRLVCFSRSILRSIMQVDE